MGKLGSSATTAAVPQRDSRISSKKSSLDDDEFDGPQFEEAMHVAQQNGVNMEIGKLLWGVFLKSDSDETGKLDTMEFSDLLSKLLDRKTTEDDLAYYLGNYDVDDNHAFSFGEFLRIAQDLSQEQGIGIDQLLAKRGLINPLLNKKLPKTQIVRFLKKELNEMEACQQLPATMLLFVVFVLSFVLHESPVIVHTQQRSIHFDLNENANFAFSGAAPFDNGRMGHKTLFDVNTFADFWSWMSMGFLPLIFHESWDSSEVRSTIGLKECTSKSDILQEWGWRMNGTTQTAKPFFCDLIESLPQTESEQGMYLFYHRILGGVRLQQELADESECGGPLRAAYGMPCYSSPYYLEPEVLTNFEPYVAQINRERGETQFFLVPSSLADVRAKVMELEDQMWARQATQRIEVAFPTYNAIEGTVTMTYIHIFMNRGGHFWKQVAMFSAWLDVYHAGPGVYLVDALWVLLTLQIFLTEFLEVTKVWRHLGLVKGSVKYMCFWNFVDWLSVGVGTALFCSLAVQASMASDIKKSLELYDYRLPGGFGDGSQTADMMTKIEDAVQHARTIRILFAFYSFVVGLRLFKVFASQPRLAIATITMKRAAVDIIHFGLVFASTIAIFAAAGLALFGHHDEEFATYSRSFGSTLRCLLGDFDWSAMTAVGRGFAGLWFWSYQVFCVNIMFNILIAIVIDTYFAVKASTREAETLWSQSYEIWRRWRQKVHGKRVGLDYVLKVLIGGNPLIEPPGMYNEVSAKDLCSEVPGLPLNQARRLIENTVNMVQQGQGKVDMQESIEKVSDKLTTVESRSNAILKNIQYMLENSDATNFAVRISEPGSLGSARVSPVGARGSIQKRQPLVAVHRNETIVYHSDGDNRSGADVNHVSDGGTCPQVSPLLCCMRKDVSEASKDATMLERSTVPGKEPQPRFLIPGRNQQLATASGEGASTAFPDSTLGARRASLKELHAVAKHRAVPPTALSNATMAPCTKVPQSQVVGASLIGPDRSELPENAFPYQPDWQTFHNSFEHRFLQMESRLSKVEEMYPTIKSMESKVEEMYPVMKSMESKVEEMYPAIKRMESIFARLEARMDASTPSSTSSADPSEILIKV